MTIVSIKSGTGAELRRLELSDGSLFSFKTCYLPPVFTDESLYTPGTAEGKEITAAEEAAFRHASACFRAEKAALQLIARAEQCFFGLSRKLERRGHGAAAVSAVLARLAELELVNDRRFATFWLETRMARSGSPRRLLAALCSKGIDRDDAEAALKNVLAVEAEYSLLLRFAKKLRRSRAFRRSAAGADNAGNRETTRAFKFALKNEGFSSAAVTRFLEEEETLWTGTS